MNKTPLIFGGCATALLSLISVAIAHPISDQPIVQGDAIRGKAAFEKRCTGCHALDQDRVGPRLAGVYGRRSGTIPHFPYSMELKQAGIVWDERSLDAWLTDPDTLVRGNAMSFHVSKPEERRDLIAFLKASSTALNVSEGK
jgi:cytochrome c